MTSNRHMDQKHGIQNPESPKKSVGTRSSRSKGPGLKAETIAGTEEGAEAGKKADEE